ncbi:SRPBCC domain-containing protein [Streptomyces sp. NPDC002133]|uniref:SRPBCC family protein n=1 Tax=Streptomyces sp. NPDC002133 TaxID=3154409 RepID=UPI00332D1983
MEHEVFVPVPAETLRQTLADPARLARCVPGLQQDADASAGPLAGRLKIRVAGHTITYRGALRITEQGGDFAVEGEGTEARGPGSAKLALTLRLTPAEGGTTLTFGGTSHAEGRLADLPADTTSQAATRLLDRFASSLATAAAAAVAEATANDEVVSADADEASAREDAEDAEEPEVVAEAEPVEDVEGAGGVEGTEVDETDSASVFEVDVPPSALDPMAQEEFGDGDEPPAEAAHARRTMIGRSAEEVDHAPPRGRYAPVPAPQPASAGGTLRWLAPAAAVALASAVVVGRALRRRR